jgi:hypothetical protein
VDVSGDADASEVYSAFIFRVKVCRLMDAVYTQKTHQPTQCDNEDGGNIYFENLDNITYLLTA